MAGRPTGDAVEILGSAAELETLNRLLAEAEEGAQGIVLSGDAGIGKTPLWEAAVADGRARGYRVLACRPVGSEVKLSFAALGDLLADVLEDTLPRLPAPQRRALEVALLLEESASPPPDGRSIGVAVLGLLRIAAAQAPVVIAIDDVQWLDRPT